MTTCSTCSATLGDRNRSGLCRSCVAKRNNADPSTRAKQIAAVKAHHADPAVKAGYAQRCAERNRNLSDAEREQRRAHGRWLAENVLTRADVRAKTLAPEVRARAGAARSATVLRDIPEAYRDEYRALCRSGNMSAPEAKAAILAQVKSDERARLAAMSPLERQMERLNAGAALVEVKPRRSAEHAMTLGGVVAYL
ncbi:hypothetical protein [Sphingomonas sp.]|uniref:hypothetical protein n=1 Tax=Sphingomonas sp. TaxID=28214 RepID=UPI0035C7E526